MEFDSLGKKERDAHLLDVSTKKWIQGAHRAMMYMYEEEENYPDHRGGKTEDAINSIYDDPTQLG